MQCQRPPLSIELRTRTGPLHTQAERSGIIAEILRGRVSRDGYALYLRNLLPAYQAMEHGLGRHHQMPGFHGIAEPSLFRAEAILRDLTTLCDQDWANALPLLPEGELYAKRMIHAAGGDGTALIGHAYTRYLGDLSGAQVLKRSLMRASGLQPDMLTFFDFPAIADLAAFRDEFRAALDAAAADIPDTDLVLSEAVQAFQHNIDISEAVHAALTASPLQPGQLTAPGSGKNVRGAFRA